MILRSWRVSPDSGCSGSLLHAQWWWPCRKLATPLPCQAWECMCSDVQIVETCSRWKAASAGSHRNQPCTSRTCMHAAGCCCGRSSMSDPQSFHRCTGEGGRSDMLNHSVYFLPSLQAAKSVFKHSGVPPRLQSPSSQLPQRLRLSRRSSVLAMAGSGDANTRATDYGQRGDGPSKEQQQASNCAISPVGSPATGSCVPPA